MASGKQNLLLGGLVGAVLFGLAVFAVEIPGRHESGRSAINPSTVAEKSAVPEPSPAVRAPEVSIAERPTSGGESIPPLPPLPSDATSIPDVYLVHLSAMVDLSQAGVHRPDKSRWQRAIPVAEQLIRGPCDCAQRNWLTRFIEMGNFALSNSETEYYDYATLLAGLGRNDEEALALSRARN